MLCCEQLIAQQEQARENGCTLTALTQIVKDAAMYTSIIQNTTHHTLESGAETFLRPYVSVVPSEQLLHHISLPSPSITFDLHL